jgi:hypothetical protein
MNTSIVRIAALKLNGHHPVKLTATPRRRLKISKPLHDPSRRIPIKFAKPASAG